MINENNNLKIYVMKKDFSIEAHAYCLISGEFKIIE